MITADISDWPCPIARATDLIGDWWTPLTMREAFSGMCWQRCGDGVAIGCGRTTGDAGRRIDVRSVRMVGPRLASVQSSDQRAESFDRAGIGDIDQANNQRVDAGFDQAHRSFVVIGDRAGVGVASKPFGTDPPGS